MNFYKLVCEYDPSGNVVGGTRFRDNVPRPIKKRDVDDDGEEVEADVSEEDAGEDDLDAFFQSMEETDGM
jgi:hypothetical protein